MPGSRNPEEVFELEVEAVGTGCQVGCKVEGAVDVMAMWGDALSDGIPRMVEVLRRVDAEGLLTPAESAFLDQFRLWVFHAPASGRPEVCLVDVAHYATLRLEVKVDSCL